MMESILRLLCLATGLCIVYGYALDDNDLKRALDVLEEMETEKRGINQCRPKSASCGKVVHPCCEGTCYWEEGYSIRKEGVCTDCVKEGRHCQLDRNCCNGLKCDKGNALWVDGRCTKPRTLGGCYRDGQCANDCKKKWYQIHGSCE